ncbi:MAG: aspartate aminotransferase family protein [Kiritimatiellae bacterium]|nr:aspartate aminotransferase family protein [Kiritimatiellia bacterium]
MPTASVNAAPSVRTAGDYDPNWARVDLSVVPNVAVPAPGPKSKALHERASRIMKGYSSQVRLFPVVFESGKGVTLTDVDGNTYIDFSSGIYVTSLGHCHPKVSEAVARYAHTLMNCHDFTTPVKTALLEKLASVSMGDLTCMQFYSNGTAAVEAGLRICRAATGRHEFLSGFMDFHGKSYGAVSCARMDPTKGVVRAPGFHMVPRSYPYRPTFFKADGTEDVDALIGFMETYVREACVGPVAAVVLEPIQGWAGSVIPSEDYFPKLRAFCDRHGILLFADEVLTCMGRTGKMFCMEHWDVVPDVMTLGKGFGNGFPVTAVLASERFADSFAKISASTSYGGNPMACAAALASIDVIEQEGLLAHAAELGRFFEKRLAKMKAEHPIIGDVRNKGCLLGVELVKDRVSKEPFDEAGARVYQRAFGKGLAWIPAGHILRMSPPIIMEEDVAARGMDIIDEAIGDVERELGYR